MKIVSLLPSATEVLYDLGLGDAIIGVSHDCDYPPEVRQKPLVSTSTVTDDLSSAAIDTAVAQTYHQGGSIYHIDPLFLRKERPDLIIAQELCQVCAVTSAEARQAAQVARSGARILSLQPSTLEEICASILLLGEATDRNAEAHTLVRRLQDSMAAARMSAATETERPRVLCLGWLEPLIVEGHWVPEMVALAGGHDPFGKPGGHSRRIAWEEVRAHDPDVILLMPCSFSLTRTLSEAHVLGGLPGWGALAAVGTGRVFALDSGYFSRPGPRLATGLGVLARCLHPERSGGPSPDGAAARLAAGAGPAAGAFSPWR